ncbi:hypothetical protein L227DRAFT_230124 [Lentinus tigrinus ALCF2SS1-6]|uniref:Uncharacterized protein n=1 Tax=Lentinus tigrinus ALCF2SS1-6 TaxID=1328759 RepID=A0A5C2S1K7_9APHY|nr:hypothetical protein L227DRAFT_230124 [Lentinus tigrinus ALCF2SS1-6]
MSKGSFRPMELVPDWLVESPITFDDLKCTSPPSTIFRMSLPPSPVDRRKHRRSSIISTSSSESEDEEDAISIQSKPPQLPDVTLLVEDVRIEEQVPPQEPEQAQDDGRSFLWDDDGSDSDSDSDGDESTLNEREEVDPSPIDPFFAQPKASVSPTPTHASSFDCTSPWFMHFDAAALAALDNQLLQSPFDAFSDLCYAQAVEMEDAGASSSAIPGSYTWRRFSRLRPLSPFSEEDEEEPQSELNMDADVEDAESESDTDSEQLASPEQPVAHQSWGVRPRVYSPTPASYHPHWHRHARHFQQDSDGSIHFRPQERRALRAHLSIFACRNLSSHHRHLPGGIWISPH